MSIATLVPDSPAVGFAHHGEVFTRWWVVELILDLVGYTPDRDLSSLVAVEPACGRGAFLVPMALRLAESCAVHGHDLGTTGAVLRAYDVLESNVAAALRGLGFPSLRRSGSPRGGSRTRTFFSSARTRRASSSAACVCFATRGCWASSWPTAGCAPIRRWPPPASQCGQPDPAARRRGFRGPGVRIPGDYGAQPPPAGAGRARRHDGYVWRAR